MNWGNKKAVVLFVFLMILVIVAAVLPIVLTESLGA